MAKLSKRQKDERKIVDSNKTYSRDEAVGIRRHPQC